MEKFVQGSEIEIMKYPWIDEFLLSMPGATKDFKEEWQWTRYLIGNKMFAAVCKDEKGEDYIVTIKLEPSDGEFIRNEYEDVTPGYYMNKIHWNSINLEGELPDALMKELIVKSYKLVLGGLSKKMQKELITF
ncbi:putative DNA-binding protein (MmcQ/YjbR family) [Sedimentibacter acidaminivorans]|uniref:DNA-binding protein (MmcQ/YjbR family) n=2 Tax=Sedimentibacter acidaminivorans TaxID=913099 RepID=A0ABS4GC06_9FIRM|nr:putative DNA-binding protein (MmcQ/YjbR family) [Sedimentibacter acidaminivorans]